MNNNKKGLLPLSDYQMYQIRKLDKELEEIYKTIKARNNFTEDFFSTHNRLVHWMGVDWFRLPTLGYLRRVGYVPLVVVYEVDTVGFNEAEVYIDPEYAYPPIDDNGEEYSMLRYVQQDSIQSKYIRLKAITFALPIFGWYKVLWRRKSD